MAHETVGKTGELGVHPGAEGQYVPGQMIPAVFFAQKTVFVRTAGGLAVAQVVVAADHEPGFGQKTGKVVIAADVFGDSVDQLHHTPGRPLCRRPEGGVDLMEPVAGGIGKFTEVDHGKIMLLMVK